MSLESKTTDIGGVTYQVTQLPAMRGFKLLNRLGRTFGPTVADLLGGATSLADLNVAFLAPSIRELFDRLTEAELETLTKELLGQALVTLEGKTKPLMPVFDIHFAGRYDDILKLLWFAVEANYGSFFGGLAEKLVALRAPPSSTAGSTISSTPGQPGGST